ncbi:cell division protein FtsL [Gallaecimonas sp. GXIMD4217]|uniref:cell division protein FtsL n=1 Tax=Gallaecimonas sp. GXIMD4217 TaxID=3131927 RepID=UPI00311AD418
MAEELWQSKGLLLLFLAVVISAFAVVYLAHHNRLQTAERERLRVEREQLDVEWRNLNLEEGALAEHSRVEELARKQLNMTRALPNDEKVIALQ